jgi:hypothetical protein
MLAGIAPVTQLLCQEPASIDQLSGVVEGGVRMSIHSLQKRGNRLEVAFSIQFLRDKTGHRLSPWVPTRQWAMIQVQFWDANGKLLWETPVTIFHDPEVVFNQNGDSESHTFQVGVPASAHSVSVEYRRKWWQTRPIMIQ